MRRSTSKPLLSAILVLLSWGLALTQTPTKTTVYIYDELRRLKAVINPSGETAVYAYDAAGNLVSITRQLSTVVSIIEFTPDRGSTGASVTIYGTGFSLTPNQNAVSFNGVAATVTAASATQLITSVPAGATSGPISITTPTGSAVSTATFEVVNALSITSFTPTIGTAGTAVQITGTDFDPTPGNNQVKFNIQTAIANSATSTTIGTTVPTAATSGRISVTTPAGTAVSTQDFFVPPPPHTAASVDFTGRIAIGETKTFSVNAVNRIALIVFDGSAGQRISLQASNSTISSSTITVFKPDGTNLFNPTSLSGNWFIDTLTLPVSGTYTILIDPNSTFTGIMSLTLHDVPADAAASTSPGGPPATVTTTTPGQNATVTFAGTTGQRISLNITNVTISSSSVTIRRPDGTTLATFATVGTGGVFLDALNLPATGNYSVFINPSLAAIGSATVTVHDVPADVTGTIVIGGAHVPVTITTPGQNAQLTFTGTEGQIVELDWTGTQGFPSRPVFFKPDGTQLIDDFGLFDNDDIYRLPVSGTYRITINPTGSSTGTTILALYAIPEPVSASIEADGPPVTISMPTAGQFARVTFNGTAGQRVSLKNSNVKMTYAYIEVLSPTGSFINDSDAFPEWQFDGFNFSDPALLIDTMTLPTTGTYTINVYPDFDASGSLTLQLYNVPPDVTATIVPGGPAVTVTTTIPGQDARVTFNGTAGQRVSLKITESVFHASTVSFRRPNQSSFGPVISTGLNGGFSGAFTLPDTGTYTIVINNFVTNAGNTTMTLYSLPAAVTGTLTMNGPPVTVTTSAPGQEAIMTFSGTAGQRMSMKVSGTLPARSRLFITGPNGQDFSIKRDFQSVSSFRLVQQIGPVRAELVETIVLPATGTYTVRVATWDDVGTVTFDLYEVPPDVESGTITIDGPPVTVTSTAARQNRALTFNGAAGQIVHLKVNNNNNWLNLVTIIQPDGFVLSRVLQTNAAAKLIIPATGLPATGTYTILTELFGVDDSVTLTLGQGIGEVTGTIATDGQPVTVNVPASRQTGRFTFNGTPDQRMGLRRTDITMTGTVRVNGTDTVNGADSECCFQEFVAPSGRGSDRFSVNQLSRFPTNFSITVDPEFDTIGGATLRLFPVPPDVTGTISINGPPVNITTTTPGQNAVLTFDGATGEQVTVRVTNNTIGKMIVELTRPTGFQQTYFIESGSSFDLPVQALPTPGTYRLLINPFRTNTGTATINLISP